MGNLPLKAQSENPDVDPTESEVFTLPLPLSAPETSTEPPDPSPNIQNNPSPLNTPETLAEPSDPLADIQNNPLIRLNPAPLWSEDYRLGPGDVLEITVFEAEEYSAEVIVLQDGSINLPRVGKVFVEGYTLQQTNDIVVTYYSTYIRNPIVTIQPSRFRPVIVGIAGAIRRPGSYTVSSSNSVNSSNNRTPSFPTLTQAIAEAGGITSQADLRAVELRRRVGPNQEQTLQINLWDLIQSGDLSQDVILQSGDTVTIPTAVALTPAESTQLASASFAPESIRVYVAGEVDDPGGVDIPLNSPLNQALLVAGGFSTRARRGSVELVRVNPDGTASQQNLAIDFAADVGDSNNPILKDQDVIVVDRSGLARVGDNTGLLLNPISRVLNLILGFERLVF
ncbi:MAG: polysaccharide biosynthesis/export family protein [Cyanobacteria bacterium P01_H01_bin.58]